MRLASRRPAIEGTTQLVGIIGSRVEYSLSPRMHNAAFAALGLDWAYVPLPVDDPRVGAAVLGLRALGFVGANVTIPHKVAVIEYCDIVEPSAERSGSANTLIVEDEAIVAASTDGEGIARGLEVAGSTCLVLGAGGASRPVIAALVDFGASDVAISSRRAEAAQALAAELGGLSDSCEVHALGQWPPRHAADIVVNTTPIKDASVIKVASSQQIVDLAYRPDGLPTGLIAAAHEAGCERVIDGLEFLVRQGAASFERWTGREAPLEVMRAAVGGHASDASGG